MNTQYSLVQKFSIFHYRLQNLRHIIKTQISYIHFFTLLRKYFKFNFFRRYFFKSTAQIIKCETAQNKMNCCE